MSPFKTLSSSDSHPAGPAGPYVAGGPVGPDDLFKVLESLEHSVLDHADPAGQHAVVQDVLEPLEHSVLDTVLDGRPMEGAPVLEKPLDDEPMKEMSVLEPLEHSVLWTALNGVPGRSTHGGDTRSGTVRAFGFGDGPGQWIHGGDVTFGTIRPFGSECSPEYSPECSPCVYSFTHRMVIDTSLSSLTT